MTYLEWQKTCCLLGGRDTPSHRIYLMEERLKIFLFFHVPTTDSAEHYHHHSLVGEKLNQKTLHRSYEAF